MPQITLPDGSVAEAVAVDFASEDEAWNEYELSDGSTLKIKLNLNGVYRVEGHYTDMGEPLYFIQSDNQIRTLNVPEDLQQDVIVEDEETNADNDPDKSFQ